MSDQKSGPSTFACVLAGLGGAVVVGGGLVWLAKWHAKAERTTRIDQLMQRFDPYQLTDAESEELQGLLRQQAHEAGVGMFGALSSATNELKRATDDYDAAFQKLLAAEEVLEPISKAFLALAWEETDAHLPRLRAAQAEVRAAKAAADAAMKRMRDWGEVVRLERKPATTEVGREADRLLNELEDLFQPRRGGN